MIISSLAASDIRLEEIHTHQLEDEVCRELMQYVEGWPDKSRLKGLVKHYAPYQAELNITHNLLLYGTRIVIPQSLRSDILDKIHESHQGFIKCRELVRNSVWWPGVSKDVAELVN
jgi:hypothetical protein